MNVKGILIEGRDGHEYLVGFGHDENRWPDRTASPQPPRCRRGVPPL
jgi:hypothetical protein